jgi:phytoene synthase
LEADEDKISMTECKPVASAVSVAKKSGSSFLYSFLVLNREQQKAIRAVYAFARRADDSVDEVNDPGRQQERLEHWREQLSLCYEGQPDDPATVELQWAIRKYSIPREYFDELLEGCGMDISRSRYETFEQLRLYCYRVASCVGLICLPIFGCPYEQGKEYAIHLGLALQLTNIIRDVGADAKRDRIYLPQEDLERFGINEESIIQGVYDENFAALMEFESARALGYYEKAYSLLPEDYRRQLLAARIMGRTYRKLLSRIMRGGYRVLEEKAKLGKAEKIWIALTTWLGAGDEVGG